MKKILLYICLLIIPLYAEQNITKLRFIAFKNDKYICQTNYIIKQNNREIDIFTETIGKNIKETNNCSIVNGKIIKITQQSNNGLDNLYYNWKINQNTFTYINNKTNNIQKGKSKLNQKCDSLQSLLCTLAFTDFTINKYFSYKLIVPPNQLHNIYVKTIALKKLEFNQQKLECWELEVGLEGIFGVFGIFEIFIPKWYFWVTRTYPHFPIKYQYGDMIVHLDYFETSN